MHINQISVELIRSKGGMVYFPELSNISTVHVGHGLKIHSHVWIGDEVVIGDNVKIQAFCFIPNGVELEDDVFLGPRVTFTNDLKPPHNAFRPTRVKKGASIGAGAVILCGITIGAGALVGAGAVVTKDVAPNTTVVGNPAQVLRKFTEPVLECGGVV